MGEQEPNKAKKHICAGLLAHVDAGKTTLSEAVLYCSGTIRRMGRVDNQDAFLDTFALERERGITIFSKQAEVVLPAMRMTLLDTPGHVDFSAEMERTLQVLDYAVLVVSGADGVQGHTRTLWRLLERYRIPTFLFINKMDQNGTDREALLRELRERLDERCVDFGPDADKAERDDALAMCTEELMEEFLETGTVQDTSVTAAIAARSVFPCFFGSALKLQGIAEFLDALQKFTCEPKYPQEFKARVFKIARDAQKTRLTYLKVTGGCLKVKDAVGENAEKVNQIRIYSGERYETVNEVLAGTICAVTGLTDTRPGQGLGAQEHSEPPLLEPVLNYDVILPQGTDPHQMLIRLAELEEEEPELHIVWNEQLGQIQAQLMGPVQTEILKRLVQDRFGIAIEFGSGSIVYKETIRSAVEGVGHFEPLRHYAEVHLLLEPGERGSGLVFASECSEDSLERSWQRLILTHLEEKTHVGVLTGSPVTDMKITLIAGRAHLKHTEGGDFRQATYRAVRQGLRQAECCLLEPYYDFRLEIPADTVGRAMMDLERMDAEFSVPEQLGAEAVITGSGPVVTLQNYQAEVTSYTRGSGQFSCSFRGYEPCHNTEEVLEEFRYDPDLDLENPSGSVFCSHGSGFYVEWDQVPAYMHLDSGYGLLKKEEEEEELAVRTARYRGYVADEKELQEIFERTYGPVKRRIGDWDAPMRMKFDSEKPEKEFKWKKKTPLKQYLLVDGYNVIFADRELGELAQINVDAARQKLMDMLCNYQGYQKCEVILVFDAYRVEGHACEILEYHNIHVVYTKEAETADQYIEKTAHEIGRKYQVTVATSDGLEQVIIRGQGCALLSSRELLEEMEHASREMRRDYLQPQSGNGAKLFDSAAEEVAAHLEDVRLGRKLFGEGQNPSKKK